MPSTFLYTESNKLLRWQNHMISYFCSKICISKIIFCRHHVIRCDDFQVTVLRILIDPGSVRAGFVVDKVALGQVFLRVRRFSMALGTTQPQPEMRTRNLSWDGGGG
jgi:hypothetical protein